MLCYHTSWVFVPWTVDRRPQAVDRRPQTADHGPWTVVGPTRFAPCSGPRTTSRLTNYCVCVTQCGKQPSAARCCLRNQHQPHPSHPRLRSLSSSSSSFRSSVAVSTDGKHVSNAELTPSHPVTCLCCHFFVLLSC